MSSSSCRRPTRSSHQPSSSSAAVVFVHFVLPGFVVRTRQVRRPGQAPSGVVVVVVPSSQSAQAPGRRPRSSSSSQLATSCHARQVVSVQTSSSSPDISQRTAAYQPDLRFASQQPPTVYSVPAIFNQQQTTSCPSTSIFLLTHLFIFLGQAPVVRSSSSGRRQGIRRRTRPSLLYSLSSPASGSGPGPSGQVVVVVRPSRRRRRQAPRRRLSDVAQPGAVRPALKPCRPRPLSLVVVVQTLSCLSDVVSLSPSDHPITLSDTLLVIVPYRPCPIVCPIPAFVLPFFCCFCGSICRFVVFAVLLLLPYLDPGLTSSSSSSRVLRGVDSPCPETFNVGPNPLVSSGGLFRSPAHPPTPLLLVT